MSIAVIGAGVSGLTSGVVLAERGERVTLFSAPDAHCASPAAAAIWFLYDVEPQDLAERWALVTFTHLVELASRGGTGVSMVEFRCYSRDTAIAPGWAGGCRLRTLRDDEMIADYTSGYAVTVPLMDTTAYLRYLHARFAAAGGVIREVAPFARLADVPREHDVIINCCGIGARAWDPAVQPHRGQTVLVDRPLLPWAMVCEEDLLYVIPRTLDCVLGGTSTDSDDVTPNDDDTKRIRRDASAIVDVAALPTREVKVGLRPYRAGGIRLERDRAGDGRLVVHNYGHGGSGFTVSWGCAESVVALVHPKLE
jgi:D-amino-acid oxidase